MRLQSSSKGWYVHRTGRITVSNMKIAAKTNPAILSANLIKKSTILK